MSAYEPTTQEGTDAELTDFDGRPDDCECWDADAELPCWPCYRDGFDEPNPDEPANTENDDVDDEGESEGRTPRRSEPADFGCGESTGVQDL